MRVWWVVLVLGCYAAPPLPASPGDLGGCAPGAHAELSELHCARDSDCLLCGGTQECGELRTRSQIALDNAPCPAPDAERCRGARAACCQGRCVLSRDGNDAFSGAHSIP